MVFQLSIGEMLIIIPCLVLSFTIHEWAHAATSVGLGDPTPKQHGRLSLNPLVHLDIAGFLAILFFGFGWAKPVVFDPRNFRHPRPAETMVALAGPASNLLLASVLLFFQLRGYFPLSIGLWGLALPLSNLVSTLIYLNLILFVFNMLPIPPLDGSHLILALIPPRYNQLRLSFFHYGRIALLVLILANLLSNNRIFSIGSLVQKILYYLISVLAPSA